LFSPARIVVPLRSSGNRPALIFAALVAAMSGIYFLPGIGQFAADFVYSLVGAFAGVAVLVGIRLHRPEHAAPWRLIALGTFLFAGGDVLWMILRLAGDKPFPSIADVSYVLGYPALALAFLVVIAVRVDRGDRSGMLDAAILATAVALLGWILLIRPVLDGDGDPTALLVGASYPLGDLVVIGVAIGMLSTPGPRGVSFGLLVGMMAMLFTADVLFAFQVSGGGSEDGGLLDIVWLAAYGVTGVAALVPSMRVVAVAHPVRIAWLTPTRLVLMTLGMLTGPVLVLGHDPDTARDLPLLATGSGVLSLLVLGRLALAVRALARDNAARRSLEEELSFRASHDPLTGLANRRGFLERLEAARSSRGSGPLTVLFLDLDDFKGINDTMGHGTGDALLSEVARRIRAHLRDGDVAARMGGDEFGVMLRVDEPSAVRVAERLLDSLRRPAFVGEATVVTRGSIGVAPARLGVGSSAQVLADADIAMYRAKAMGKGRVCLFADDMRAEVVDRMRLEADLREAIDRGELQLEYQPIVDLATGRATIVEALIRWPHPVRGVLAPGVIIPLAEASGLVRPLGDWILRTACAQVATWRHTLEPSLGLAVNLSPRQVADRDLVSVVQSVAASVGLPVAALMLEVTEAALMEDGQGVLANLAALRALGAWVAIDDFGAGHSSLGMLGRLPVDLLKIDPVFLERLDREDDRRLAGILVGLGDALGLRVVAEGIERQDQLDAVRELGCGLGQGFLLAPPMTPAAFEACFAEQPASAPSTARRRFSFGPAVGA
jgi:diguanylate cyclase